MRASRNAQTAVVTGSTGGLGRLVARRLAERGWDLVLLDRTRAKQERVEAELNADFPDRRVVGKPIDLMDLRSVEAAIGAVKEETSSLGALWNVAGLLTHERRDSAQGIEAHFAVNTVAPYALMKGLRTLLAEGAKDQPAYIANFTTEGVTKVKALAVDSLKDPAEVGGLFGAYSLSKAALQVVGVAMADELAAQDILLYAVDPGATKTSMTDGNKAMPWIVRLIRPLLFQPAEKQAAKLTAAVEAAIAAGETNLFISGGKRKAHPALASDQRVQGDLRALLDALTA